MSETPRTILTIGNFDGVHAGHRALVHRARELAAAFDRRSPAGATRVVALAFDPHPATVLRPGAQPPRLTTFAARRTLLRDAGADDVERLEPTPALLGMSAEAFIGSVVTRHRPVAIVEGDDFRFGKARAGDVAALRAMGRARPDSDQFAVHVVEPVTVALGDQTVVTASSSMARWLIERGRMADAARILGRPYTVQGHIVQGDRRGRTLGYPTANVAAESMLPADGVYAAPAIVPGESGGPSRRFVAAVSVGTKPQFNAQGATRTLEAHLLDAPRQNSPAISGLPEYGWRIALHFIAFLREQARFDGVPALIAQIERDCARVREAVALSDRLPEATLEPRWGGPTSLSTVEPVAAAAGKEAPECR